MSNTARPALSFCAITTPLAGSKSATAAGARRAIVAIDGNAEYNLPPARLYS